MERVRVWKSTWGKNLNYFPISFWSLTQSAPKQITGGRERSELKMLTSESSLSQAKSKKISQNVLRQYMEAFRRQDEIVDFSMKNTN